MGLEYDSELVIRWAPPESNLKSKSDGVCQFARFHTPADNRTRRQEHSDSCPAKQMRHADVRTTLEVYVRVIPQSQRDAMKWFGSDGRQFGRYSRFSPRRHARQLSRGCNCPLRQGARDFGIGSITKAACH
jgi:hypothetical protein